MYEQNSATTKRYNKKKQNKIGGKVRLHFDKTKLTLRQKSYRRGEGTTKSCPLQI